jgi:hypothetical protein
MDVDFTCPVCDKIFRTAKARNTHLSTAKNCSWYRHGKFKATQNSEIERRDGFRIYDLGQDGNHISPTTTDLCPEDAVDQMEETPHSGDYEDLFHFLGADPAHNPDIGEAGPGPSTIAQQRPQHSNRLLDDEDDSRLESIHPTAGKVIRMNDTLHEIWRQTFQSTDGDGDIEMEDNLGGENMYAPFASELDWRIAHWMVKENPGHGAFDRLLEIPGVSYPLYP